MIFIPSYSFSLTDGKVYPCFDFHEEDSSSMFPDPGIINASFNLTTLDLNMDLLVSSDELDFFIEARLNKSLKQSCIENFCKTDIDSSGSIDFGEIVGMEYEDNQEFHGSDAIYIHDLKTFEENDCDRSLSLDLKEYCGFLSSLDTSDPIIFNIIQEYDRDGNGCISQSEYRNSLFVMDHDIDGNRCLSIEEVALWLFPSSAQESKRITKTIIGKLDDSKDGSLDSSEFSPVLIAFLLPNSTIPSTSCLTERISRSIQRAPHRCHASWVIIGVIYGLNEVIFFAFISKKVSF